MRIWTGSILAIVVVSPDSCCYPGPSPSPSATVRLLGLMASSRMCRGLELLRVGLTI